MNYIYSNLQNQLTTERAYKLQYIIVNKRLLENMGPKEWKEEKMLLAEDMQIELNRVKMGRRWAGNFDDDILDKQDDNLVI